MAGNRAGTRDDLESSDRSSEPTGGGVAPVQVPRVAEGSLDPARGNSHCLVCASPLAGTGGILQAFVCIVVRERLVEAGIQPFRPICGACSTRLGLVVGSRAYLSAEVVGLFGDSLDEFQDPARRDDKDGT